MTPPTLDYMFYEGRAHTAASPISCPHPTQCLAHRQLSQYPTSPSSPWPQKSRPWTKAGHTQAGDIIHG